MIKLSKSQIKSLVEKIKMDSYKKIDEEKKLLREGFVPSEKEQEQINKAEIMDKAIQEYNLLHKGTNSYDIPILWRNSTYTPKGIYEKFRNEWVEKQLPRYNFSGIEDEINVRLLQFNTIDEIVEFMLNKFRIL